MDTETQDLSIQDTVGNAVNEVRMIEDSEVDVSVVLGATSIPLHQLLRISRGAVIELDARETDPVIVYANNLPIAKGAVLVDGNHISVTIGKMLKYVPGLKGY